jgi:hypothetical protein
MAADVKFLSKEENDHQKRLEQFETALKQIMNDADDE